MESNAIAKKKQRKKNNLVTFLVGLLAIALILWLGFSFYTGILLEKRKDQLSEQTQHIIQQTAQLVNLHSLSSLPLKFTYLSYTRGILSSNARLAIYVSDVTPAQLIIDITFYHGPLPLNRIEKFNFLPIAFSGVATLVTNNISPEFFDSFQTPIHLTFSKSYSDNWNSKFQLSHSIKDKTKIDKQLLFEDLHIEGNYQAPSLSTQIKINNIRIDELVLEQLNAQITIDNIENQPINQVTQSLIPVLPVFHAIFVIEGLKYQKNALNSLNLENLIVKLSKTTSEKYALSMLINGIQLLEESKNKLYHLGFEEPANYLTLSLDEALISFQLENMQSSLNGESFFHTKNIKTNGITFGSFKIDTHYIISSAGREFIYENIDLIRKSDIPTTALLQALMNLQNLKFNQRVSFFPSEKINLELELDKQSSQLTYVYDFPLVILEKSQPSQEDIISNLTAEFTLSIAKITWFDLIKKISLLTDNPIVPDETVINHSINRINANLAKLLDEIIINKNHPPNNINDILLNGTTNITSNVKLQGKKLIINGESYALKEFH